MADFDLASRLDRRRALALGGGAAGGLILAGTGASAGIVPPRGSWSRTGRRRLAAADAAGAAGLPVQQIESILQAPGTVSNGVLSISMSRTDLGTVKGPLGVPFEGPFELNFDIYFQSLGKNKAILNGDVTLKPNEVNPFIDALIKNGLVFQALPPALHRGEPADLAHPLPRRRRPARPRARAARRDQDRHLDAPAAEGGQHQHAAERGPAGPDPGRGRLGRRRRGQRRGRAQEPGPPRRGA